MPQDWARIFNEIQKKDMPKDFCYPRGFNDWAQWLSNLSVTNQTYVSVETTTKVFFSFFFSAFKYSFVRLNQPNKNAFVYNFFILKQLFSNLWVDFDVVWFDSFREFISSIISYKCSCGWCVFVNIKNYPGIIWRLT